MYEEESEITAETSLHVGQPPKQTGVSYCVSLCVPVTHFVSKAGSVV